MSSTLVARCDAFQDEINADVSSEVAAAITRLTRGNFRLLTRLLTRMQRVVEINQLSEFSIDVVETARENLVIGQA